MGKFKGATHIIPFMGPSTKLSIEPNPPGPSTKTNHEKDFNENKM
jgi:hypothetical protein